MSRGKGFRFSSLLLLSSALTSCGGRSYSVGTSNPPPTGGASYFPYKQGWLGADGAYSVPLGGGQSLWIFCDTFIGPTTAISRTQATGFIHNSIAISTCSGRAAHFSTIGQG